MSRHTEVENRKKPARFPEIWPIIGLADEKTGLEFVKASGNPFFEVTPAGGESLEDLLRRAARAVRLTKDASHPGATVLVSGHGALNKALVLHILGLEFEYWPQFEQQNCCVNSFEFDKHGRVVSFSLNDVSHLPE